MRFLLGKIISIRIDIENTNVSKYIDPNTMIRVLTTPLLLFNSPRENKEKPKITPIAVNSDVALLS